MIPFAPFEPDRSPFALDASELTRNCLPIPDGWGPKPDLTVISQALDDTCVGAVYVRATTGVFYIVAGTRTKLYRLDTTDYSWIDISRASGGDYGVPLGDRWSFAVFGGFLIAVNVNDAPQYVTIDDLDSAALFDALPGNPPKAKYIWSAGGFLVLGHLEGYPTRIQWSGYEDIGYWEVGLDKFADLQDLNDGGEDVMGGVSSENGAIIFQRRKIKGMEIGGGAFAIRIFDINPGRGIIAPLSIASVGPQNVFYLSEDGFMQGAEGIAIGENKVDRWILDTVIDRDRLFDVRGVADPYRKIVWWQIPKPDSTQILLGYRWTTGRWCWADNNVIEMAAMVTPAMSWDGLGNLYDSIDDVDLPFDSRLFAGGRPEFAAFTPDNKLAYQTGAAMTATIRTARIEPLPDSRAWCDDIRLVADAPLATCKVRVGTARHHQEPIVQGPPISGFSRTGLFNTRVTGRVFDFQVNIAAGAVWSTATGIRVPFRPEGQS